MADGKSIGDKIPDNGETSVHPTDRGWAWIILLAAWLNMFFIVGMYKTFGIFFIEFQKKYNSSSSMTSLTISLLNFGYSLSTLLVSSVMLTLISSRQCVMIGSVMVCVVYVVSAFALTIEVLIFTYGLFLGCSQGLIMAPSTTLLGQYFSKRRSLANCVAQTGASTGSLVFPILLRALLDSYGLFGTLLFVGAINLHLLVSGSLMRPTSFYQKTTVDNLANSKKDFTRVNDAVLTNGKALSLHVNGNIVHENGVAGVLSSTENQNGGAEIKTGGNENYSNRCEPENPFFDAKRNETIIIGSDITTNGIHKDIQEPLLYQSPVVARAILGHKQRQRYVSELSYSSKLETLEAAISNSSIGRRSNLGLYASTELSISSVLDLRLSDGFSQNAEPEKYSKETKNYSVCCFGNKLCSKLSGFLDCRVLRRLPFWLFVPSACLLCNSCSMMLVYLPPHAQEEGLVDSEITTFMSVIGAVDIISLLLWGLIADCGTIKRYQLVTIAAVIFGIISLLISFFETFSSFLILSVICGLIGRVYFSMYPVLLVDFLGLEYLRSALGLLIMIQTIFSACAIPLLGLIRDATGSYITVFHTMGIMMIIGGLWVLTVPLAVKYENRKRQKTELHLDELS